MEFFTFWASGGVTSLKNNMFSSGLPYGKSLFIVATLDWLDLQIIFLSIPFESVHILYEATGLNYQEFFENRCLLTSYLFCCLPQNKESIW